MSCMQRRVWFWICWTIATWYADEMTCSEKQKEIIRSEYVLKFLLIHLADLHGFVMICSDWLLRSWPSSSSWVWCHLQSLLLSLMYLPLQLSPASPNKDANLCGAHALRHEQDTSKPYYSRLFFWTLAMMFDFIKETLIIHYRFYTRAFHKTMGKEMQIIKWML